MLSRLVYILNTRRFYTLTGIIFIAWLSFFDRASLIKQWLMYRQLRHFEALEKYYGDEVKTIAKEEKEVMGNLSHLEEFGREKYLIKKEGETVFVFVDKEGRVSKP